MSPPSAPQLAELLGLLRNARDPWSRLRLVARGARALSRLTPAQRGDLLRTLGLEGAEELAELAAGGDPQVERTLDWVLRSLESDPRRVERIAREIADPRTRRATLTGLAAHVMEAVTAPPPESSEDPVPAAVAPQAPPPKQQARPAAAPRQPSGPGAPAGGPRAAPKRTPATTAAPAQTPGARRAATPAQAGAAAAGAGALGAAARAALEIAAEPATAERQPPAPATAATSAAPAAQAIPAAATPPPWTGTPAPAHPQPAAVAAAPAPPRRRPTTAAPTAAPPPAATAPTAAPDMGERPLEVRGSLARLRALRRALASGPGVSAEALDELLDSLTSDWARRRALAAAFASGVPARLEDALALVGHLGSPAARRWALGDLAASRPWSDGDWERLLAAADSPLLRRRLAARRALPGGMAASGGA